jgi:hypothetical protein
VLLKIQAALLTDYVVDGLSTLIIPHDASQCSTVSLATEAIVELGSDLIWFKRCLVCGCVSELLNKWDEMSYCSKL